MRTGGHLFNAIQAWVSGETRGGGVILTARLISCSGGYVLKLQKKPVLLPVPFLLGRDCTFQRQTGPKRALKEVMIALEVESFFLLDSDPGWRDPHSAICL